MIWLTRVARNMKLNIKKSVDKEHSVLSRRTIVLKAGLRIVKRQAPWHCIIVCKTATFTMVLATAKSNLLINFRAKEVKVQAQNIPSRPVGPPSNAATATKMDPFSSRKTVAAKPVNTRHNCSSCKSKTQHAERAKVTQKQETNASCDDNPYKCSRYQKQANPISFYINRKSSTKIVKHAIMLPFPRCVCDSRDGVATTLSSTSICSGKIRLFSTARSTTLLLPFPSFHIRSTTLGVN